MPTMRIAPILLTSFSLSLLPMAALAAGEVVNVDTTVAVEIPSELTCAGQEARRRASCITDTLKKLKRISEQYDQKEDDVVEAWRKANAHLGISPEYQKGLRVFHQELLTKRKAFNVRVLALQKAFYNQQKEKRIQGAVQKPTNTKTLDAATFEAAKAKCGEEDDDGAYRMCLRLQLRIRPTNVDRRSRSSTKLLP